MSSLVSEKSSSISRSSLSTTSSGESLGGPALTLYERVQEAVKEVLVGPLAEGFQGLGIHETDKEAQTILQGKLVTLENLAELSICPLEENPGVWKISKQEKPVALFKLGNKRANIELAARQIAHLLGLGKYVVAGSYYAMQELPLHQEWGQDLEEDLWDGKIKTYLSQEVSKADTNEEEDIIFDPIGERCRYFGILEDHIEEGARLSKEEFVWVLLTALAIGLRDLHAENIRSSVLVDAEECMPNRIEAEASQEKAVAATHLPFLRDYEQVAKEKIAEEVLQKMKALVGAWNIDELTFQVQDLKILFVDSLVYEMDDMDAGECSYSLREAEEPDDLYTPKEMPSEATPVFDEGQVDAFKKRLERIKETILGAAALSPQELIQAVDPDYVEGIVYARSDSVSAGSDFNLRALSSDPFNAVGRTPTPRRSSRLSRPSTTETGVRLAELEEENRRLKKQLDAALAAFEQLKQKKEGRDRHLSVTEDSPPLPDSSTLRKTGLRKPVPSLSTKTSPSDSPKRK
ncbi:MAG: hypothetical protein FJZ63_01685 [Chlamydiae bacterium]|nr:hypothetical protein [Chlamydiota bacterium]